MKILFFLFFFIHHFSIVLAHNDLFSSIFEDDNYDIPLPQINLADNKDFRETTLSCEKMGQTSTTPFIVLFLLKTSGHFLGMGSIIDKKTCLTANKVVESCLHTPSELLALAGRLNPWWGKNSQVSPASEIYMNDALISLIVLKRPFRFTNYVKPIKIPVKFSKEFSKDWEKDWGVFGIPRSSWDVPGEAISKTSTYVMKVETEVAQYADTKQCMTAYPDIMYNYTTMTCTFANGTYSWGVIGSPTVAVNKDDKMYQIAVIVRASFVEDDNYHVHVKLQFFDTWIRSHSSIGFKEE